MSISIKELLKKIDINIIDIRSIEKYNDNHIENARHIPMLILLKEPEKYLKKTVTYYIYCQIGLKSHKLCKALSQKGYKVVNVIGGYESWLLEK